WLVFFLGLPQFIFSHPIWTTIFTFLPFCFLILCIFRIRVSSVSPILFISLFVYYVILTSSIGHHNFQMGIFLSVLPILFPEKHQIEGIKLVKYWILIYYTSAAFLKLSSPTFFQTYHFSNVLAGQFIPYRLEQSNDIRLVINQWLISHVNFTWVLYFLGFLAESFCLIGFFTRKFDKFIGMVLILLHIGIWIIMDIAPIGQMSLLFYFLVDTSKENKYQLKINHMN
ncbi:MAG: hypothetical protein RL582_217, partial [Bacteroidota bacterium]